MRRILKWSAPAAALLALGVSAQAQDFQATVARAQTTLTNIDKLIDGIMERNKAAAAASASGAVRTASSGPAGGSRTYTLILTGAQ